MVEHIAEEKRVPTFSFGRVSKPHRDTILHWLDLPHVKEFWDNSPEHREDIDHFIGGRIGPAPYFKGVMTYWIGFYDGEPFSFILTSTLTDEPDLPQTHRPFLSKTGTTTTLDFCIGNEEYLGKGLAAETLEAFMDFFKKEIDPETDTFFIDPDEQNPRAKRVYEKAGFREVANFQMSEGYFEGQNTILMTRRVFPEPDLIPADPDDHKVIQNLARFYVYEISRYCANDPIFKTPEDGNYECFSLQRYFQDEERYAFLVRVGGELAGFALIHTYDENADWSMAEFFIVAKFQGYGIGKEVAIQLFENFGGSWAVSAIPENITSIRFWDKVIEDFSCGVFTKTTEYLTIPSKSTPHPKVVWRFG